MLVRTHLLVSLGPYQTWCVALDWLNENYMIANPSNVHALLIKKDRTNTNGEEISIRRNTMNLTIQ